MFKDVIQNTLIITSFVLAMMLIIEYINVQTRGKWSKPLRKSGFLQVFVSALLGVIPGCMGVYTVVSLYTHNIVNFGALVATMIATSGDEAYFMLSMMPREALIIFIASFVLAIITGLLVNVFVKRKSFMKNKEFHLVIHEEEQACKCFAWKQIIENLKHISFHRAILLAGTLLFVFALFTNVIAHEHKNGILGFSGHEIDVSHIHSDEHNHEECTQTESHEHAAVEEEDSHNHGNWNWFKITFLIISLIALFIIVTVPDHFLTEHLWGHIIKKHFLKIFLWTFGALVAISLLFEYADFSGWIVDNHFYVLLVAVLIGIIPESGPHLVFVSLFVSGSIPLSILLANSIVQDGHGSLPLFAESKRSFLYMKIINIAVGFVVGLIGLQFGF
ncbi:MAG: arsenic efflux protein [Bacteroidales bacterium]|nr:arsenic efflux protein [Bacteroidales bacterium]